MFLLSLFSFIVNISFGQVIDTPKSDSANYNTELLFSDKNIDTKQPLEDFEIVNGSLIVNTTENWSSVKWHPVIKSKVGSAWITTNNAYGTDYQMGFGMASSGWYFIETKADGTRRYPFLVTIDGHVVATKVIVELRNWPDYVFYPNYNIMPLNKLDNFIQTNKHLPGVPNEKEIDENGLDIGEMQKIQMQKIEELTLYIIELNKKIEVQQKEIEKLKQNK